MDKVRRSLDERIREMERKQQELIEKAKCLDSQKRELKKRYAEDERKKRTHRLIEVGAAVESVLGCKIEAEDLPRLIGFLKKQEENGRYFSKAMKRQIQLELLEE